MYIVVQCLHCVHLTNFVPPSVTSIHYGGQYSTSLSFSLITLSKPTRVSANPTMYIATAIALAMENMMPMAPPNSGPKDLEIR